MSLTREEREELANLYAEMRRGGKEWNPSQEKRDQGREMLDIALWAALCHTTGRCGMAVDQAFPGTSEARIYQLMMKALLSEKG